MLGQKKALYARTPGMIKAGVPGPSSFGLHIMRPYNEISATSRYSDKDIKDSGQGQCQKGGRWGSDINTEITIYIRPFTPTYLQHIAAICVA